MPMYEKGSVRAGPRSKQQERMKKIMKKFLSSLLALTMILSLVIVPAQANNDPTVTGATVSGKSDLTLNETTTYSVSLTGAKAGDVDISSGTNVTYKWTVSGALEITGDGADKDTKATVSVKAKSATTASAKANVTCTITYTPSEESAISGSAQKTGITVTDPQGDFANDISIKVQGNEYKDGLKYIGEALTADDIAVTLKGTASNKYSNFNVTEKSVNNNTATIKATATTKDSVTVNFTKQISVTPATGVVSIKADGENTDPATPIVVVSNQEVALSASYAGNDSATCKWTGNGGFSQNKIKAPTWTAPESSSSSGDEYTLTCTFTDGSVVKTGTVKFKVVKDHYKAMPANGDTSFVLTPNKKSETIVTPYIQDTNPGGKVYTSGVTFDKLTITSGRDVISDSGQTIRSLKSGTAKFTATVTFNGIKYTTDEYTVTVTDLDKTLSAIDNDDDASYSENDLKDILADVVNAAYKRDNGVSTISASNISTVTLVGSAPTYLEFTEYRSNKTTKDFSDGVTIAAKAGYLGEKQTSFVVSARDTKNNMTHTITLTVPVSGADSIKDTVTGTSANKEVTFTNDDYDYLYYSYSKPTYEGYFNGSKVDGFEYPVKENKTVTVPASKFSGSNKTVTLYVVGVDNKGVASTGTITVSQKSYDINYNVVAGKSVSFSQKDFEDFLENYADDNGEYNSRKDELSFDHAVLTSSIPSTRSEGTLYYGSTEITSSNKSKTDMTDMDKVSFDSVSKPSKDTVSLTFRVYGDLYKDGSRTKKEVKYDVNVVISVVKEDITYTVGIDDTVQLTARDFVNFLQDAKTSYRKSTLDYVKFDVSGKNVSSYAYGGLYRSYSSYSTGKLADSTDKFYYEPSRTQYDLADVAYHTTRWAEAGKTVYIPFTVYGTKNEEASGTMAITIAQTMNFIDVKPGDFFYEPVKWAVNNKITNGTSSTTFSPYKNCNRAEIVTFLWRAAGSPEPTVTRNPFTDVNSVRDASYYKAILWASQKGITAGSTATTFSPYQECTRSQIVTFLYRYAGKPSGYYSNPFKDVSSVNEASYYNAILWAVGKGITDGTSTTTFSPYASCTRGQAVTFLYRYVNGVK